MKKIQITIFAMIFFNCTYNESYGQCTYITYSLSPSGYMCSGASGNITLSGSQTGTTYQLKNYSGANVGSAVAGTGAAITWANIAYQSGTYTVHASRSGCTNNNVLVGSSFIGASIPALTREDVIITASNGGVLNQNDSVVFTVTKSSTINPQQSFKNFQLYDRGTIGITTTNNQLVVKTPPPYGDGYYIVVTSTVCGSVLVPCPTITVASALPADTMAWLQANIIAKSSNYIGKQFSVLMDTLQMHGFNLAKYGLPAFSCI
jgi:hypothetical protein